MPVLMVFVVDIVARIAEKNGKHSDLLFFEVQMLKLMRVDRRKYREKGLAR